MESVLELIIQKEKYVSEDIGGILDDHNPYIGFTYWIKAL